jgi:hypothetical protein
MLTIHTNIAGGKLEPEASAAIREAVTKNEGKRVVVSLFDIASLPGLYNVVTIDKVIETVNHLDSLASTNIDPTNGNAITELLNELSAWLPEAGRIQASAKFYLLNAQRASAEKIPDSVKGLSATALNKWLEGSTAEYSALYERCERLTKAITHRCDHLRTFLSYQKEEMKLSQGATAP